MMPHPANGASRGDRPTPRVLPQAEIQSLTGRSRNSSTGTPSAPTSSILEGLNAAANAARPRLPPPEPVDTALASPEAETGVPGRTLRPVPQGKLIRFRRLVSGRGPRLAWAKRVSTPWGHRSGPAKGLTMARHVPIPVEPLIVTSRGQRVIPSPDLARVYGVDTRVLNQAVKRNPDRFPTDFAFRLTSQEALELRRLRSQSVILEPASHFRHPPLVSTEHGALMAANVLKSPRAVQMSVFVVRAFVRMRGLIVSQAPLTEKLAELERRVTGHDAGLKLLVRAVRQLLEASERPRPKIGYRR